MPLRQHVDQFRPPFVSLDGDQNRAGAFDESQLWKANRAEATDGRMVGLPRRRQVSCVGLGHDELNIGVFLQGLNLNRVAARSPKPEIRQLASHGDAPQNDLVQEMRQ